MPRRDDDALLETAGATPGAAFERLVKIMKRLRAPDGCPWDQVQTFETIAPYTVEEAYEVADAIERKDMVDLSEELGDLALQVVYHAEIADEAGAFDAREVLNGVCDKMLGRHPHVFGDAESADWEEIKAAEKAAKTAKKGAAAPASLLDDVPKTLPALTRALKLQKRAARVGFDWTEIGDVLAKLREEVDELVAARQTGAAEKIAEEFGDLLFVLVNVGRHLKIEPEEALRAANRKFTRRFAHIERALAAEGRAPDDATLAEMDALWDAAKRLERGDES